MDRFRINPIPITEETKNLFHCLDTQQIFEKYSQEIILETVPIIQYNYRIDYSKMININKEKKEKKLKFKKIVYSHEDKETYGNEIPNGVHILGDDCFRSDKERRTIDIPSTMIELECVNVLLIILL